MELVGEFRLCIPLPACTGLPLAAGPIEAENRVDATGQPALSDPAWSVACIFICPKLLSHNIHPLPLTIMTTESRHFWTFCDIPTVFPEAPKTCHFLPNHAALSRSSPPRIPPKGVPSHRF